MAALYLIISGIGGAIGAVVAWSLGAGYIMVLATYAVTGNLIFSLLSIGLHFDGGRKNRQNLDAEIEADLRAFQDEQRRIERLQPKAQLFARLKCEDLGNPLSARHRTVFRAR